MTNTRSSTAFYADSLDRLQLPILRARLADIAARS